MSATSINVLGYTGNNRQFVVKTLNTDLRISENEKFPELEGPNPYEYILAGLAGCINSLDQLIATEQNIVLDSLQVEISGNFNDATYEGRPTKDRAGFTILDIILRPTTKAPLTALQKWIKERQTRSPVYVNLVNTTPVDLVLYKEYNYA